MLHHTRRIHIDETGFRLDFLTFELSAHYSPRLPKLNPGWYPVFAVHGEKCIYLMLSDGFSRGLWILSHAVELISYDISNADPIVLKKLFQSNGLLDGARASERDDEESLRDLVALADYIAGHAACFATGFEQNIVPISHIPVTDRQSRALTLVKQLKAGRSPSEAPQVFPQRISRQEYEDGRLDAIDVNGEKISWRYFLPLGDFAHLGFTDHPNWRHLVVIVSSHVKHVVGVFDRHDDVMYEVTPACRHILPRAVTWSALLESRIAKRLLSPQSEDRCIVFRENHIGHYLWNELATVDVALQLKGRLSVFLHAACDEPLYKVDEVFPELEGRVQRGMHDIDLVIESVINGREFFPFSDFKISKNLRHRIDAIAYERGVALLDDLNKARAEGRTIVLIGVRLENRKWPGQFEGYKSLINKLQMDRGSYLVLFDGHNYLGDTPGAFVNSHMERALARPGDRTIVEIEQDAINQMAAELVQESSVTIKSLVPCTISDSLVAALSCHYFITHWGAGLAKYKWLTNGYGGVFSSRAVLSGKGDLRIYDVEPFLEGAVAMDYFPSDKVVDLTETAGSLLAFKDHSRENFELSAEEFSNWAFSLIKSHANGLHSSEAIIVPVSGA